MRPIATSPDVANGTTEQERQASSPATTSRTESRTHSRQSARLEDIVGVPPRAVRPVRTDSDSNQQFLRRLDDVITNSESFDQTISAVANVLAKEAGFAVVATVAKSSVAKSSVAKGFGGNAELQALAGDISKLPTDLAKYLLKQPSDSAEAAQAFEQNVVTAPIDGDQLQLLGYSLDSNPDSRLLLSTAAAQLSSHFLRRNLQQVETDVRHTAAIIELIARISGSRDIRSATSALSSDLCSYLSATRVFIGICSNSRAACRLAAVSNEEFDPQSASTHEIEGVLQESIARGTPSLWPPQTADNRHALLAHQHLAQSRSSSGLMACPLSDADGESVGAILVEWTNETETSTSAALPFLNASATPLGSTLKSLRTNSRSLPQRIRDRAALVLGPRRLMAVAAAVLAVAGIMAVPVDYRVTCEAELQPVSRRFVAAPFDAPLKTCLVEPGDVVEQNQLLAELDGRELRWELAGIQADLGKATKEHNAFLSERKSGDAAIARHEIERLQNREAVLSDRIMHLEIRSPQTGIVVAGDLKDTEGVPLETGESLFEIAPLDQVTVEIAIPEDDVRHVNRGMKVSLILDSAPSKVVTATIQRLHPRAEIRDDENVFVAEALVENSEGLFRPGMKGQAKVSTGTQPLGWTVLHKPLAHVYGWLGW